MFTSWTADENDSRLPSPPQQSSAASPPDSNPDSQPPRPRHRSSSLLTSMLPPEILVEVVLYLPLPSLQSVLCTSSLLFHLSERPSFWRLVAQSHFPPLLVLQRRMRFENVNADERHETAGETGGELRSSVSEDDQEDNKNWLTITKSLWHDCGEKLTSPVVFHGFVRRNRVYDPQEGDEEELIPTYEFSVRLCGMAGVGKTSLVDRFHRGIFNYQMESTIGGPYRRTFPLFPPHEVIENENEEEEEGEQEEEGIVDHHKNHLFPPELQIETWDTAGQERYMRCLSPMFFCWGSGQLTFFCFSATSRESMLYLGSQIVYMDQISQSERYAQRAKITNRSVVFVACMCDRSADSEESTRFSDFPLRRCFWEEVLLPLAENGWNSFKEFHPSAVMQDPQENYRGMEGVPDLDLPSPLAQSIVEECRARARMENETGLPVWSFLELYETSSKDDVGIQDLFVERNRRLVLETLETCRRWPDTRLRETGDEEDEFALALTQGRTQRGKCFK